MDRRDVLAAFGGIGLATLGGCTRFVGQGSGGNGSPEFTTSFEGDSLPGTLTDTSERSAPAPELSADYASSGSQSLLLSSRPGTRTKARVTGTDPVRLPASCRASVRQVESGGTQNSATLSLVHARTTALVEVHVNPYDGAIRIRGRNSTTGGDPTYSKTIVESALGGEWRELSIEVDGDRVVGSVDGRSTSIPVPTPLSGSPVYPSVGVNAWGNGDPLSLAVDELAVASP